MANRRKTWVPRPSKPSKATIPVALKLELETKARELITSVLKPLHVKPPPDHESLNYIVDIDAKWYRNYFYFFATYCSPGPTAISPSFESKFARLEYVGANDFALAFMRHTGQWEELYPDLSLEQCLEAIRDDPFFIP